MALPYREHPIYRLRKWTFIVSILGLLIDGLFFGFSVIWFLLSILCCVLDLIDWATRKVQDPDHDPKWPRTLFIVWDAVLCIVLQLAFWYNITLLSMFYYYPDETIIFGAYAVLMFLLVSVLHGWIFCKQFMGRKKADWLSGLPSHSCARCGWMNQVDSQIHQSQPPMQPPAATADAQGRFAPLPNTFPYVGPSAVDSPTSYQRADDILTPQHTDSTMEEGLLIGSDIGTGYGSISASTVLEPREPTLEQPSEVVVGGSKASKKKKAKGKAGETDGKTPKTDRG